MNHFIIFCISSIFVTTHFLVSGDIVKLPSIYSAQLLENANDFSALLPVSSNNPPRFEKGIKPTLDEWLLANDYYNKIVINGRDPQSINFAFPATYPFSELYLRFNVLKNAFGYIRTNKILLPDREDIAGIPAPRYKILADFENWINALTKCTHCRWPLLHIQDNQTHCVNYDCNKDRA